jgi:hypothetical protein
MDLPPFLTQQSHDRSTLLRVAAKLISGLFSLSLIHGQKKKNKTNMSIDTQACFREPPVCTLRAAFEWSA